MKYSWEEKIRAVEHYLSDGSIDYPESCLTPSQAKTYANHVRFWKAQYLLKGKEGLRHKEFNSAYSPEAKYKIIKPILDGTVSCTEQACRTGIGSGQLLCPTGAMLPSPCYAILLIKSNIRGSVYTSRRSFFAYLRIN